MPTRRTILTALTAAHLVNRANATQSGESKPLVKAPPHSADCHFHIYDSRFPYVANAVLKPAPATVADYRRVQQRLGTTRCVLVQPSSYGTDNSCMLDALRQFGARDARAIAVVDTTVTDRQLSDMQQAGVRGIRFNLLQAGATTLDMLPLLAKRVAPLGWHLQVNVSSAHVLQSQQLFAHLPCPIVFDHFAHTVPGGRDDLAFAPLVAMLKSGRAWLKLSGAYMDTKVHAPTYSDTVPVARAYVAEAPNQLVWGSDWPHPIIKQKPDDATLFNLLTHWVPDAATRSKILVDNPSRLYGFA